MGGASLQLITVDSWQGAEQEVRNMAGSQLAETRKIEEQNGWWLYSYDSVGLNFLGMLAVLLATAGDGAIDH